MSPRTLAAAGALSFALLAPAGAQAEVTMEPLKPCYVTAGTAAAPQAEGVAITAAGFTPNAQVDLMIDGAPVAGQTGLQADAAGYLTVAASQLAAPFIPRGTREFTVTLTEQGNTDNAVSATAKTTALGVAVKPRRAHPGDVIRFKGRGFTGDKPVFAHYVYKGTLRKTVRMARHTGSCGVWTSHRRQIPVRRPKPGLWTVQFDQSRRYRDGSRPDSGLKSVFVRLGISVTLVRRGG